MQDVQHPPLERGGGRFVLGLVLRTWAWVLLRPSKFARLGDEGIEAATVFAAIMLTTGALAQAWDWGQFVRVMVGQVSLGTVTLIGTAFSLWVLTRLAGGRATARHAWRVASYSTGIVVGSALVTDRLWPWRFVSMYFLLYNAWILMGVARNRYAVHWIKAWIPAFSVLPFKGILALPMSILALPFFAPMLMHRAEVGPLAAAVAAQVGPLAAAVAAVILVVRAERFWSSLSLKPGRIGAASLGSR